MIEGFIKFIGGAAILLAATAWLIRSLVVHFLSKDIQSYKSALESERTIEIERLRNDLQKQVLEHQVRFTKLHEERAATVAETYGKLRRLYNVVMDYVVDLGKGPYLTYDDLEAAISNAVEDFQTYYDPRCIYLPIGTADKISEFEQKLLRAMGQMKRAGKLSDSNDSERHRKTYEKLMIEVENISGELPGLFKRLELEFRSILDLSSNEKKYG